MKSCGVFLLWGTAGIALPAQTFTTLHSFDVTDGSYPNGLVQGTDGNFYGTTSAGGDHACKVRGDNHGCGTVFKITLSGELTTLYNFCPHLDCADGRYASTLIQGTDGNFYETTSEGGTNICRIRQRNYGCGTVFSLSVGLGPFVKTNPVAAKMGTAVALLGTNLTGASGVTFNGIAATFAVVSSTEITTAVPTGATTGTVQVVTPSGTLSSDVPFHVLP